MMNRLPSAVLFACTQNAIRSPMAAALMHHYYGHRVYVASAGLRPSGPDPFVGFIMEEIGIDLHRHRPHSFDDLADSSFDLAVSLSEEAHLKTLEMTRTMAITAEHWPTPDPSATLGSRDHILEAYRAVRDGLARQILARFPEELARGK
jgi:protein-tyrosine-phosphatase